MIILGIEPSVEVNDRLAIPSTKEVIVTGENKMSKRMMRKCFKNFGEVEEVTEKGDDKLQFIVTFTNSEGLSNRKCIFSRITCL